MITLPDDMCYYATSECDDDLWQCESCDEYFCQLHFHTTDKGHCVECVACEEERFKGEAKGGSEMTELEAQIIKAWKHGCPMIGTKTSKGGWTSKLKEVVK